MNNLLLSFPRSGNTWVRYVFEYITKQPTSQGTVIDCQRGIQKTDAISVKAPTGADLNERCILIKRHRADFGWDNWTKENTKLVFLLRSYKEAIIRHSYNKDDSSIADHVNGYMHCLDFYDKFDGDKILVMYESLVLDCQKEVDRMMEFLGVPKNEHYEGLFNNIEHHKQASIESYGASATKGRPELLKTHAKSASNELVNEIVALVKANNIALYKKYLRIY